MRTLALFLLWLAALLLALAAIVPELGVAAWWALMWEFPRPHALVLAVVLGLAALALRAWIPLLAFAAVAAVQAAHVLPYTPLARPQVTRVLEAEAGAPIELVVLNVKMDLEDRAPVIEYLRGIEPDILLLMEVDETWIEEVRPILDRYETTVSEPRGNYYGMVLATNLPAERAEAHYFEKGTPAVVADLEAPDGGLFTFLGLHPQPPQPGRDMSDHRDQLLEAGELARQAGRPVVAAGDFNEPGWATASREFRRMGDYLDPRVGRFTRASFDAGHPFMRFAIDHVYVTTGIDLISYGRGPEAGSDHRPITARFAVTPEG